MKMRKIKIVSDGISRDRTKVLDAETGEMIEGVQSVKFETDVNRYPIATIVVLKPVVEIDVESIEVPDMEHATPPILLEVSEVDGKQNIKVTDQYQGHELKYYSGLEIDYSKEGKPKVRLEYDCDIKEAS